MTPSQISTLVIIGSTGSKGYPRYIPAGNGSGFKANRVKGHNDGSVEVLVKAGLVYLSEGTEYLTEQGKASFDKIQFGQALKAATPSQRLTMLKAHNKARKAA
jgi:hypothetical protein